MKENLDDNLIINTSEKPEEKDKFKIRMKTLFNEFEENKNTGIQAPSSINFSEKEIELSGGCKVLCIYLIIIFISLGLIAIFSVIGADEVVLLFLLPIPCLALIISIILSCCQLITIPPGYALVLTYYGKYVGTCKSPGFYYIRPCADRSLISLQSNQFNGNMIKVNDKEGTSDNFMKAQTESAIRYIANKFSYDSNDENEPTLKSGKEEINELLKLELQRRTKIAGIEIEDARITEISYGDEIANVMLQKQAADAIIHSKAKIAKGAVDIIDDSIKELEKRNVCKFSDEERCRLVGNMMVVLNMDKGGNAIINCK